MPDSSKTCCLEHNFPVPILHTDATTNNYFPSLLRRCFSSPLQTRTNPPPPSTVDTKPNKPVVEVAAAASAAIVMYVVLWKREKPEGGEGEGMDRQSN